MSERVGTVSELWRYPVQSLQGEQVPTLDLAPGGSPGDRFYCVAEAESGAAGVASRPPWKMLITWKARYLGEPRPGEDLPLVEIGFPDGDTLRSDDAGIDAATDPVTVNCTVNPDTSRLFRVGDFIVFNDEAADPGHSGRRSYECAQIVGPGDAVHHDRGPIRTARAPWRPPARASRGLGWLPRRPFGSPDSTSARRKAG